MPKRNRSGHGLPARPGDLSHQPWEGGWELEPGYAYKKVRGRWSEPVIVSEVDAAKSHWIGDTIIDGTRMRVFKVGRSMYAQTYGRKSTRNMTGKVGGVKLARHPRHKHLGVSKEGNVSAGRVHADRFYSFDELPRDIQKDYADWAQEDTQFVRRKVKLRGGGVGYDFTPMENFQHVRGGKSPSGRPADGFASDSYFSGTAIKLIPGGDGSDHEYQVWLESW